MSRLSVYNVFVGIIIFAIQFVHNVNSHKIRPPNGPLYLTPYIKSGDITAGQRAASVQSILDGDNTESYSGYFTVNSVYNSHMFSWFFPAEKDSANAPLVVWLHGGPGLSSIWGIFELGPYQYDKNKKLTKRDLYWSQKFNMLFIDNPVGTGFSYTEKDEGYSRTQTDIGHNLYLVLEQFYQLFPEYKKNDLYVAGSSYAGKYVPALGYFINANQDEGDSKMNLKGMMIGNAFSDPATIINRSEILYQTGMIGKKFKATLDGYIQKMLSLMKEEKYKEALDVNAVMRREITEQSGYVSIENLLYNEESYPYGNIEDLLNCTKVKSKIHVGDRPFKTNPKLVEFLTDELLQSVKPWVEQLLEKYKLLMYSGQLDIEIPYILNSKYMQSLNWSGAEDFKKAERKLWRLDNKLVGYTQSGGRLSDVLVRNAGHNAHIDKPKELFDIVNKFIYNTSL